MLKLENVSCSFGALQALRKVSLSIDVGEVLGLVGPNGSGKSTMLNVITGLYAPDAGTLKFDGKEICGRPPHEIASAGIARTFQTPRLYQRMSVRDNLEAARVATGTRPASDHRFSIDELAERAGLAARVDDLATQLTLPEQRRLELVRTQVSRPLLVLLDEPAGGMTPAETAEMAELIQSLINKDQCWIIIEHKMDLISSVCDRVVVLNFGQLIADGPRADVFDNPVVIEAYLGPKEVT